MAHEQPSGGLWFTTATNREHHEQPSGSLRWKIIELGLTPSAREDVKALKLFEADEKHTLADALIIRALSKPIDFAEFYDRLLTVLNEGSKGFESEPTFVDNLIKQHKLSAHWLHGLKSSHRLILTNAQMQQGTTSIEVKQIEHFIHQDFLDMKTYQWENTSFLRGAYRLPGGEWQSTSQLEGHWDIISGEQHEFS